MLSPILLLPVPLVVAPKNAQLLSSSFAGLPSPLALAPPQPSLLAGKVYGGERLLAASSPAPLAAFQLFSSLAAFSGAAGQASYASGALLCGCSGYCTICPAILLPNFC